MRGGGGGGGVVTGGSGCVVGEPLGGKIVTGGPTSVGGGGFDGGLMGSMGGGIGNGPGEGGKSGLVVGFVSGNGSIMGASGIKIVTGSPTAMGEGLAVDAPEDAVMGIANPSGVTRDGANGGSSSWSTRSKEKVTSVIFQRRSASTEVIRSKLVETVSPPLEAVPTTLKKTASG